MEINNGNQPAYSVLETDNGIMFHEGLTKREHFASLALQGICASGILSNATDMARATVLAADALLQELENSKQREV